MKNSFLGFPEVSMAQALALIVMAVALPGCRPATSGLSAELPRRLGYSVSADESFMNDCGDRVTAMVRPVKWAPLGEFVLAVIPAGANVSCYGDGPGLVTLWSANGLGSQPLISHRGYLSLLPGTARDTAEVALGGGGSTFQVLRWNGAAFEPGRVVSEAEFSAGIVLP